MYLIYLFVCLSVFLSNHLSTCASIYYYIHVNVSSLLSMLIYMDLSLSLLCLSACLSACMHACMYVFSVIHVILAWYGCDVVCYSIMTMFWVCSLNTLEVADSHLYIRHSQGSSILCKLNHSPREKLLWTVKTLADITLWECFTLSIRTRCPNAKSPKFCLSRTSLT